MVVNRPSQPPPKGLSSLHPCITAHTHIHNSKPAEKQTQQQQQQRSWVSKANGDCAHGAGRAFFVRARLAECPERHRVELLPRENVRKPHLVVEKHAFRLRIITNKQDTAEGGGPLL